MYYIGVDLGGTNIAIGIVDENKNLLIKGSVPTIASREGELIVKDMAALVEKLMAEKKITLDEIAYVGIAAPGTANSETGVIEYANNLPFVNFPIAEIFKRFLPVRNVYVENDANAAALGEALAGAAKGSKTSAMITLGTGVGGGIVLDGKIYAGFNLAGGEMGHMVIHQNGRLCSCGRRGCFEAYSSATALSAITREKIFECEAKRIPTKMIDDYKASGKVTARTAFSAMKAGDAVAAEVVDYYIDYLACGITNIINILQPEILCIGGGICNEKDNLLIPLMKKVNTDQYTRASKKKTKVVIAALGNDAGIIGAACLKL